jgi:ribosome-binding protein aMBF1 (putative translation factor)
MHEPSVRLRSATLLKELMRTANNGEGLSLRDMADRLPCGKSMIHALTNGTKQSCTETLGKRIAEVLGVATPVLFMPDPSIRRGRPFKQQDAA